MKKKEKRKYLFIAALAAGVFLLVQNFALLITLIGLTLSALTPLLIGCIIAYIFNIVITFFEKHYFPKRHSKLIDSTRRPICMIISFAIVVAVIILVIKVVVPEVVTAVKLIYDEIPNYYNKAKDYADRKLKQYPAINKQINSIEINKSDVTARLTDSAFGLFGSVISFISSVTSAIINAIIGIIFAIYLLLRKDKLREDAIRVQKAYLSEKVVKKMNFFLETAHETFTAFFIGQFIEAIMIGTLTCIGSLILRIPYPAMTGTIVGMTALIPIAGPVVGTVLSALIICSVSVTKALLFVVFLIILQQIDDNILYPKVVGTSIGLPGIWVIAAITIGGSLFGIMGMLLGVPLAATLYKIGFYNLEKKEALIAASKAEGEISADDKPPETDKMEEAEKLT
ncbi:MAG: AI-2E family transporter [Ruminococcus sp.]|nr:AI-2E family transporter [Ruminococcus sp.]